MTKGEHVEKGNKPQQPPQPNHGVRPPNLQVRPHRPLVAKRVVKNSLLIAEEKND